MLHKECHECIPFVCILQFSLARILLWDVVTLLLCLLSSVHSLQNKKIKRVIDLTSQLARETLEITVLNDGDKPDADYYITLPLEASSKLSFILASTDDHPNLPIYKGESKKEGNTNYALYVAKMPTPIEKNQERKVIIYMVFVHAMAIYPEEITQSERQLVKYSDNHYFYSPYPTGEIQTNIKLASSSVQSHTELHPSVARGDQIQYGTYHNLPPFSFSAMSIHFENNRPFVSVSNFKRIIEISNWGNVAYEDHVTIHNHGARLKGPFSRYDYQINPQANGQSALKVLRQYLPFGAEDVYYRDEIGNISTSALNDDEDKLRIDIRPRFPLFGGWKTDYYLGYNLATERCLYIDSKSGRYVLNTTLIANWDLGLSIDQAEITIIFPEGSSDEKIETPPFSVESDKSVHFTYLDYYGRPVLKIRKNNLVNEHNQYFVISYNFSSSSLYLEPFLLISGFFILFTTIIFVRRLDQLIPSIDN